MQGRTTARFLLALIGISSIALGMGYMVSPHAAVGITGMELPTASAAIDARATYGGTQVGLGIFMLWCRRNDAILNAGLMLVCTLTSCLASARLYGFIVDGGPDGFNTLGAAFEGSLAVASSILLTRTRKV